MAALRLVVADRTTPALTRQARILGMPWARAAVLAAMFLVFVNATVWSLVLPYDGGSDEREHFAVVTFIAQHQRLPVAELDLFSKPLSPVRAELTYASQPPLPYILAASLVDPLSSWLSSLFAARLASVLCMVTAVWCAFRLAGL